MKKTLYRKIRDFAHYEIVKKRLFRYLSDKQFAKIDYFLYQHKFPNIDNPTSFSEKLQWMKVYGGLEKYWKYVDKYVVREFISKEIGDEYLIPLIGVWDRFEDIDFNKLPNKFVIKGTHGSGYVYLCKDKTKLDLDMLKKLTNSWLKENFYKRTREKQYDKCPPRLIIEKYLEDDNGELINYKIFCFNGKPHVVEIVWDNFTDIHGDIFMDLNWNRLDIMYVGVPEPTRQHKKPENLDQMLKIAEILSEGFPFVRVDLYSLKGKIYFGELTFTPASGTEEFTPIQLDNEWGKLIDLKKYKTID